MPLFWRSTVSVLQRSQRFQHRKHHHTTVAFRLTGGEQSKSQPSRSPSRRCQGRQAKPLAGLVLPIVYPMDRRSSSMSAAAGRWQLALAHLASPICIASQFLATTSQPARALLVAADEHQQLQGAKPAFTVSSPISSVAERRQRGNRLSAFC
jgi:hypothetical protein